MKVAAVHSLERKVLLRLSARLGACTNPVQPVVCSAASAHV